MEKEFEFQRGHHLFIQSLKDANPEKGESKEGQRERREDFNTPLCNLYVSLATPMGVPAESFADGNGELGGLMKG
ncbi:MAG: hypothetical protein ACON4R_03735 [Akkermansiaceae bacterium]